MLRVTSFKNKKLFQRLKIQTVPTVPNLRDTFGIFLGHFIGSSQILSANFQATVPIVPASRGGIPLTNTQIILLPPYTGQ